jgi:hypothetical protein
MGGWFGLRAYQEPLCHGYRQTKGMEFTLLPLPFRIPGGGTIVYQN